jgi:hypothetical protein
MRSVMVKHVELRGIEEYAALPFAHEAVVRRAIPQPGDRVAIFVGACVTVAVLHTLVSTKLNNVSGLPVVTMFRPARPPLMWSRLAKRRTTWNGS